MKVRKAAVIGATGVAGQQFLASLVAHPFFQVTALAASPRSARKRYERAITSDNGAVQWFCTEPLAQEFARMEVQDATAFDPRDMDVVFTAVESDAAKELEPRYAKTTPVISTASAFRYETDVPIFIPGVNMEHARLIPVQQRNRDWKGFITPVPNCTTMGLAMTLKPLDQTFGVDRVFMTSLQACSGAGRASGVLSIDIFDNVIPYIPKEEEKVQTETQKILGCLGDGAIQPASFEVSATCMRVPVLEAHTEAVYVSLRKPATTEEVKACWRSFAREFLSSKLPSCPSRLIYVSDDPFRPQPRLDRNIEDGMVTAVGRLRADTAQENGFKYVLVSHNTKMGAAKGAMNNIPQIRPATVDDLPEVLRLNQSALPHVSHLNAHTLRMLFDEAAWFRIAMLDNNCSGFLIALMPHATYQSENYLWFAQHFAKFLYIDRICVSAEFRRRGVASYLYADAERFACDSKIPLLTCEVNLEPENAVSIGLHDRHGFREVGTQRTEAGTKLVSLRSKHVI